MHAPARAVLAFRPDRYFSLRFNRIRPPHAPPPRPYGPRPRNRGSNRAKAFNSSLFSISPVLRLPGGLQHLRPGNGRYKGAPHEDFPRSIGGRGGRVVGQRRHMPTVCRAAPRARRSAARSDRALAAGGRKHGRPDQVTNGRPPKLEGPQCRAALFRHAAQAASKPSTMTVSPSLCVSRIFLARAYSGLW